MATGAAKLIGIIAFAAAGGGAFVVLVAVVLLLVLGALDHRWYDFPTAAAAAFAGASALVAAIALVAQYRWQRYCQMLWIAVSQVLGMEALGGPAE